MPQKNPVPRIGRTLKGGYQDRPFKPSRKLLKQLKQTQQQFEKKRTQRITRRIKREAVKPSKSEYYREQLYESAKTFAPQAIHGEPQDWYTQFTEGLKLLGEQIAAGIYTGQLYTELPEANLLDKIAVLSNILDYEQASEILDTDEDLLLKALQGGALNRYELEEIRGQYSQVYRDSQLQDDFGIDIDNVEQKASILTDALKALDDLDSMLIFRNAVADGEVSLDKLEKGYGLFKDLTRSQAGAILDKWLQNQSGNIVTTRGFDLDEMFDMYFADGGDFWNIDESLFWEWFRELDISA